MALDELAEVEETPVFQARSYGIVRLVYRSRKGAIHNGWYAAWTGYRVGDIVPWVAVKDLLPRRARFFPLT